MQARATPPVPIRFRKRVWTDAARIFSTVCNPFLTSLALFVILAGARSNGTTDFWILLFNSAFFTSIAPMLFIFWLYATDRISDLDMSIRTERERVFIAFVVFFALGALDLWLIRAPAIMIASMAGYTASLLIVQWITRYWKISTHALGVTAPLIAERAVRRPPGAVLRPDPAGRLVARLPARPHPAASRRRHAASGDDDAAVLPPLPRGLKLRPSA